MKKKLITSTLLAMALMMAFSVTAFARDFSVSGGGLQTSVIEYDSHDHSDSSDGQKYYVSVEGSLNYAGSRAWNSDDNISASARVSGSGNTLLLFSAKNKEIRYRGYGTEQNLSWNAHGTYSVD